MRKFKEKEFEKNRETMDLLTSHPRFLDRIKSLRALVGIPEGGFVSNLDVGVWYEKIYANEGKFSIFNLTVSKIVSEFNLGPNFFTPIETFLVFNKILAPDSLRISMNYNNFLGQEELRVQVFGETKEDDWRRLYGTITKLQKHLPNYSTGRFRIKTNLMVEKTCYELSTQRKSHEEIARQLSTRKLGIYDVEEIGKYIFNFKERLQRFNPPDSKK